MKAQDFIQAMNDIDEKYIKEAAYYKPSKGSMRIWRAVAIAACACLAVSVVLMMTVMNQGQKSSEIYREDVNANYEAGLEASSDYDVMYEAAAEEVYYDDYAAEESYEAPAYEAKSLTGSTDSQEAVKTLGNSTIAAEVQPQSGEYSPRIIYNVYMEMQTKEYDSAISEIEQAISANNGYSESQNQTNNSGTYRNANYTIRIPAENLDDFLAQTGEIGTVTYIDKSVDDVTESYYDIQSRLDAANTKLGRLQELLGQAEDMADIIELESAISDTQWEIDNYSGSLRSYDSQVKYSTVNISLREVYEIIHEEAPLSFGEKIAQAFSQGVRSVGEFFKNLVIWISASWIWLIIAAAVIVAVILIISHVIRRRKQDREDQ